MKRYFVNRLIFAQAVMFFINYNDPWYFFELIPFVLIGIFGGIWGAIFIKANIYWCRIRKTTVLGNFGLLSPLQCLHS